MSTITHDRTNQCTVTISLEALCKVIRTHPGVQSAWKLNDTEPISAYVDHETGTIKLYVRKDGISGVINKTPVAEYGTRTSLLTLYQKDIK